MTMKDNRFINMLHTARKEGYAVGAFNIFNDLTLRGVITAANEAGRPIIIQTSAGTVKRLGAEALGGMVNAARSLCTQEIALHLDHCKDDAIAKACVDNGWDAIMCDYSTLPLEENIARTQAMIAYAHAKGVAVEGEVGAIFGVEEDVVAEKEHPATYEDTMHYVHATGIDAIAPAIGTAHGMYKGSPKINWELIERLGKEATPLVVHGGTGLSDETFRRMVELGAAKINISTAIKYAYRDAIVAAIPNHPVDSPMELDKKVEAEVHATVLRLIKLFAGIE